MTAISPLAFIELAVVGAFAVAWMVLELVCRRLDREREATTNDGKDQVATPQIDAGSES
jgi:hypothetical protein